MLLYNNLIPNLIGPSSNHYYSQSLLPPPSNKARISASATKKLRYPRATTSIIIHNIKSALLVSRFSSLASRLSSRSCLIRVFASGFLTETPIQPPFVSWCHSPLRNPIVLFYSVIIYDMSLASLDTGQILPCRTIGLFVVLRLFH